MVIKNVQTFTIDAFIKKKLILNYLLIKNILVIINLKQMR